MSYHWKAYEIVRITVKDVKHVETFVASHRNHFDQSQVNYVQRGYGAQMAITERRRREWSIGQSLSPPR